MHLAGLGLAVGVGSAGPSAEGSRPPEASGVRVGPQAGPLPSRTPDPSSGALRRVEASGGRVGSLHPAKSGRLPGRWPQALPLDADGGVDLLPHEAAGHFDETFRHVRDEEAERTFAGSAH
jgi:hypothetical protein